MLYITNVTHFLSCLTYYLSSIRYNIFITLRHFFLYKHGHQRRCFSFVLFVLFCAELCRFSVCLLDDCVRGWESSSALQDYSNTLHVYTRKSFPSGFRIKGPNKKVHSNNQDRERERERGCIIIVVIHDEIDDEIYNTGRKMKEYIIRKKKISFLGGF